MGNSPTTSFEITETNDGVAMLVTLDKEVYEEDLEAAMADESHKEADGDGMLLVPPKKGFHFSTV